MKKNRNNLMKKTPGSTSLCSGSIRGSYALLAGVLSLGMLLTFTGCGNASGIDASMQQLSVETDADTKAEKAQSEDDSQVKDAETIQQEKTATEQTIFVHVCGAVEKPGVYEVPQGSRNYEAVEAAGGFLENACTDYLNMAKLLEDGVRIEIPTLRQVQEAKEQGYVIAEDGSITAGDTAEDGLVNINKADAQVLTTLPGVGQSRADAIVAYREEHGEFKNKEDIMQVSGIKEGLYGKIEGYISVD